jgi:ABC-2 type transport system ATP-binding protein
VLEIEDVSKSYHGVPVVRSLSLRAGPGQVVGLLGPNGSGKSTTVRMIVGLLRPSSGVLRWRGTPIQQDLVGYQTLVGYVPEEPKLYTYLTAVEYLELVGGLRDLPRTTLARRIDRYLELFALDTDRHTPLGSFSKGMRQKVLLAAALLHDPALLVLDEPNSGLDVTSSLMLRTLVATLAERGKVIIYSSHILDAVEKCCHDVVVLHASRVVASGPVSYLRSMTVSGTLEDAFTTLAVDGDPRSVGRDLADVASPC